MNNGTSIFNTLAARKLELRYGIVVLLAVLLSSIVMLLGPLQTVEWYLIDAYARWNHRSAVQEDSVAVVLIDDDVVNRPHGWPIAKSAYEELCLYLLEMGASAIVFDVLFADDLSWEDTSDAQFLRTVSRNPNLVFSWLAYTADSSAGDRGIQKTLSRFSTGTARGTTVSAISSAQLPYERLLGAVTTAGFMNRGHPYPDNVERRMPLVARLNDHLHPSLALAAVMRMRGVDSIWWNGASHALTLGNRKIHADARGEALLDFRKEIPAYRLSTVRRSMDLWLRGEKPALDSPAFSGRIVFIGNGAISLHDFGVTPLSRTAVPSYTPNVLLHARSAATMLSGNVRRCVGPLGQLIVIVLLIAALSFIRLAYPRYRRFLLASSPLIAGPLIAAPVLYIHGIVIFPVVLSLSAGFFMLCDFVAAHRFNVHPADAPKAYLGGKPFVFISYKHKELRKASRIMFRLQSMGCRIWYDRSIETGEMWREAIQAKIKQSGVVFFCASPEAVLSREIQYELCQALEADRKIVSVCIDHQIYDVLKNEPEDSGRINKTVLEFCRNEQMIDVYNRGFKKQFSEKLKSAGVIG